MRLDAIGSVWVHVLVWVSLVDFEFENRLVSDSLNKVSGLLS